MKEKPTLPSKIAHFLTPDNIEELEKQVKDYDNLASYSIMSQNLETRNVLTNLRDIPSMLYDPIIKASVSAVMNTAFQTDTENNVFHTSSSISSVQKELDAFHESIDAQNLILLIGYNLILWGQLPFKHCFSKDHILERVIPIADFTKVVPIIISGQTVGFMYNGEFRPSYEFTYAQTSHFKNLGGNSSNNMLIYGKNGDAIDEFANEFVYADSYLSSVSKAWRNIQVIEDALLLARMDQSNYYRIISVDVGGQVYSKSAIRVLNFYRNLFKKVRRVSYDAQGMASKGNGQNFEVIVPKTENQGVDIKDVGGNLEVKALKDLDTQYQRLFAGLQIQPSIIGFSDDVPSSLGDSTAITFDRRFAKVCKVYSVAAFNALKNIDYLHLRSMGFDVKKSDWSYGTVNSQIQDEQERAEVLKTSVENYKSLVEVFNTSQLEYDKNYLTKALLGGSLASFGVDVDKMLSPESSNEQDEGPSAIKANFTKDILDNDAHTMSLCGLFEEKDVTEIFSAIENENSVSIKEKVSPISLKQLCSSVAVNKESPLDLSGFVVYIDSSVEDIEKKFGKKPEIQEMVAEDFAWPVYVNKEMTVNVEELSCAYPGALNKLYVDKTGCRYLTSKKDLLTYLSNYLNNSLDVYCQQVIRETLK